MTGKKLPRREALKTLAAATGAITLASLPQAWETPVVEAGALPAHAQSSAPPRIGNLQLQVSSSDLCSGAFSFLYTFFLTYDDPAGGIEPDSIFNIYDGGSIVFQDGLFASDFVAGSDGFSGALEIPICLDFIANPGIQLISAATGLASNILSTTTTMSQVDDEKSAGAAGQVHTSGR